MAALNGWYAAHAALLNLVGVNILLALSLSVPLKCNALSLANAAFMGIGAYTTALLMSSAWPLWVALPAGALAAALAALLLGSPIVRLPAVSVTIATIGFGAIFPTIVAGLVATAGSSAIRSVTVENTGVPTTIALLTVSYLLWHADRSRLGQAFTAIRQDETAAASLGINVTAHKLIALTLGAAIAGLAGGLSVQIAGAPVPDDFGLSRAVLILAFAVVGGTGGFWGVWPAAALFTLAPAWLQPLTAANLPRQIGGFDLQQIAAGAVLLLFIIFFPSGVSGLPALFRRRFAGRLQGDERTALSQRDPAAAPPAGGASHA